MAFVCSECTANDLAGVIALCNEGYFQARGESAPHDCWYQSRQAAGRILIGKLGSQVVAAYLFRIDGQEATVELLCVAVAHRRQHLGSQLCDYGVAHLQAQGVTLIHALSNTDDSVGHDFLDARGDTWVDDETHGGVTYHKINRVIA